MRVHRLFVLANRVLVVIALAPVVACVSVLGIDDSRTIAPTTSSDAGPSDAADASDSATPNSTLPTGWVCLDSPVPAPSALGTVHFTIRFFDPATLPPSGDTSLAAPIPNFSMRACGRLDLACVTPIGASVISDANGVVVIPVPNGFDGYYEVTGRSDRDPTILVRAPQTQDESATQGFLDKTTSAAYLAAVGGTRTDGNGTVTLIDSQCDRSGGPGITYDVNATGTKSPLLYLANGLPSGATATDASGAATMFNVSPGAITVSATLAGPSRSLGTRSTVVRAGWATFMYFYPPQSKVGS